MLVYFDREGYPTTTTRRASGRPDRLDLLHDRHAEHDRLRRHRAGQSPHARLINAFVITPLRIAFLVLLIGTTLEVLASQGREMFRVARWRKHMDEHVVVVGYGTKGRSAVETLVNNGRAREGVIIVDPSPVGGRRRVHGRDRDRHR